MKQKINIRLSLIALIAIITTAVGITMVYYSLFQGQVRNDLKQNAVLLVETDLFQNAYTSGKESSENLEHLSSGNLRITWVDADGTVLFDNDTDIAGLSNHLDRPEIQRAFENGEGESTRSDFIPAMLTFMYSASESLKRLDEERFNEMRLKFMRFDTLHFRTNLHDF